MVLLLLHLCSIPDQITPYPTKVLQHIADTYVVAYYLDHSKLAGTHIHEDRIQDFFLLLLKMLAIKPVNSQYAQYFFSIQGYTSIQRQGALERLALS